MGRSRIYTPEELLDRVQEYFAGISRMEAVTELTPTGETDKYGHELMTSRVVCNDAGEPIRVRRWAVPPTVGGLCRHLGVHRSTWSEWAKVPDYAETVEWANDVMQTYLEEELLTRPGKDTKGVEFALQANYGLAKHKSVEVRAEVSTDLAGLDVAAMSDEELKRIVSMCEDTEEQNETGGQS